jgi:hypothetical protein
VVDEADLAEPGRVPRVQRQSRVRFRRPATGVSGQVSLSSSEEDESRLSPARGCLGRGELSRDVKEGAGLSDRGGDSDRDKLEEALELASDDTVEPSEDRVETEASRSECAKVYLTVVISSSSGVRKDTRFSAGNMGRAAAILRGTAAAGRLVSMETRLCGCL